MSILGTRSLLFVLFGVSRGKKVPWPLVDQPALGIHSSLPEETEQGLELDDTGSCGCLKLTASPAAHIPHWSADRNMGPSSSKQAEQTPFENLARPPHSLWSVSFLEASVGSWVCAADVFEHEKEPWQEPSICQTVSGEPLSFLSDTSQLACLTIHLPKCDRIFSCY